MVCQLSTYMVLQGQTESYNGHILCMYLASVVLVHSDPPNKPFYCFKIMQLCVS